MDLADQAVVGRDAMAGEGLALLEALVGTPSLSGEEGPAAALLARWLAAHGCQAEVDGAGNAVGWLDGGLAPGGGPQRTLILLGHIDTVGGQMPVEVREGQLYGRGAVDAKGPLSAFATALATAGARPGWRIVVVGAVEEEAATSKGARHILATHPRPDLAVIGEPSGWQRITLGYKGRLLADATVRQAMAHRSGGTATACELAVDFWNRAVAVLAELNEGRERAWDQVLASLRAFSSGDDGLQESAQLRLGFRLPPDIGPGALEEVLRAAAGDVALSFSGAEVAYRADKNTPLARAFLSAVRAEAGQPAFLLKTGTSDMNVVGPIWRCPILAYGPGDSRLDHTPEEHLDLAEWERSVAVLARVLRGLPAMAV